MMNLNQHNLFHTNGRLGLIFSQQTVEVSEYFLLCADVSTVFVASANVKAEPDLSINADVVQCPAADVSVLPQLSASVQVIPDNSAEI